MKTISTIFIFFLLLTSCKTTKQLHTATLNEANNLVGIANKSDFQKPPFADWFTKNYEAAVFDMNVVNQLKPLLKEVKITAVMGTWCSDSRREVSSLYKLLDLVDYDYKNLKMITVNRDKESLNNEQEGLFITRVPTFIFYKNGVEFNRFVEYPLKTIEKDFFEILQNTGYKNAYYE